MRPRRLISRVSTSIWPSPQPPHPRINVYTPPPHPPQARINVYTPPPHPPQPRINVYAPPPHPPQPRINVYTPPPHPTQPRINTYTPPHPQKHVNIYTPAPKKHVNVHTPIRTAKQPNGVEQAQRSCTAELSGKAALKLHFPGSIRARISCVDCEEDSHRALRLLE